MLTTISFSDRVPGFSVPEVSESAAATSFHPYTAGMIQPARYEPPRPPRFLELQGKNLGQTLYHNSNPIPTDDLPVIYASYIWYFNERYLLQEEVTAIEDHIYKAKSDADYKIFRRFDDPKDKMTIELQKLGPKYKDSLRGQVSTEEESRAQTNRGRIERIVSTHMILFTEKLLIYRSCCSTAMGGFLVWRSQKAKNLN